MNDIPQVAEKYKGEIAEIVLGKGDYVAGGAKGMPFLSFENPSKRRPMIAGEVVDDLEGYPEMAARMFDGRQNDPVEWAVMWKELGMDAVCVRLLSTDPARRGASPEDAAETVRRIADRTGLPVIVCGCGDRAVDGRTMAAVSGAVKDSRLILAKAEEEDYKTVSAAAMANGHVVLGFSNLDINLAKQMNILLSDFGIDGDSIIMDPLMAPLGMGLDYSYSVNERIRLAALSGDGMLQQPMLCDTTSAWDVGDATSQDDPALGDPVHRATWWEVMSALAAMMSGADILVMRGPAAADMVKVYAAELTEAD
ncbi:MAG: acetyl-CoA decarbonylase/synthase complex subunit delta [Candidatus Methanomethylophilaceae archaeon]|jgi:acetyl-CoA decarbonylase/synthase complex subunit delta|nr:acetyl-CoA decarbonylase/synthase complex subunit delta [Candidatus Methanomethylophilaceae archaeon]NLF33485.1 acetyl-CoA decarbonylase/synthase complex subunit delta [Thermoplasmatales archaeon]